MTTYQFYEKAIKPLSMEEKLSIARLIINEIAPDVATQPETGFEYLKRLLPQIERIIFTDQDLAGVVLDRPKS